jgi:hypothetical protein
MHVHYLINEIFNKTLQTAPFGNFCVLNYTFCYICPVQATFLLCFPAETYFVIAMGVG